jgi:hypothetical protein
MTHSSLLVLTASVTLTAALAAAAQSPLATAGQHALDRQSLRVLASEPVKTETALVAQSFAADPYARTVEGKRILEHAVDEVAYAGVVDAINRDPAHARLQWVWAPAHSWSGAAVPSSKVLMPNVDNVFRIFPVDNRHRYRLTAHLAGPAPTQLSLQLLPALPGEDGWSKVIQEVVDEDIHTQADGSFTLTIGPQPTAGQTNHITTTQDAHFILIRDTIQDWAREMPYRMELTCLDGPGSAAPADDAALAREAANVIHQITPRIVQAKGGGFANSPGFYQGPPNAFDFTQNPRRRAVGVVIVGPFPVGRRRGACPDSRPHRRQVSGSAVGQRLAELARLPAPYGIAEPVADHAECRRHRDPGGGAQRPWRRKLAGYNWAARGHSLRALAEAAESARPPRARGAVGPASESGRP